MTLTRKTPLRRTAMKRKAPSRRYEFSESTKDEIHRRSRGFCEASLRCCSVRAVHIHHIGRRRPGFTDTAAEGLDLCLRCHEWIHSHPADSEARGWLTRSGA